MPATPASHTTHTEDIASEMAAARALRSAYLTGNAEAIRVALSRPMSLAEYGLCLRLATDHAHLACIEQLLERAPLCARQTDRNGQTALMLAAQGTHIECLHRLLPLSDPLAVDAQGYDALKHAVDSTWDTQRLACVRTLLPLSDPLSLDAQQNSVLWLAIHRNAPQCLHLLLEAWDARQHPVSPECLPLLLGDAVAHGHWACADLLLLRAPVSLARDFVDQYGTTHLPMWLAHHERQLLQEELASKRTRPLSSGDSPLTPTRTGSPQAPASMAGALAEVAAARPKGAPTARQRTLPRDETMARSHGVDEPEITGTPHTSRPASSHVLPTGPESRPEHLDSARDPRTPRRI